MIDADDMAGRAYVHGSEHLRDELRRCWLRVEYQIRRAWELGTLPRVSDDAASGIWAPNDMTGIFRAAQCEFVGSAQAVEDAGAQEVLDAFTEHTRLMDGRLAASIAADVRLPLLVVTQCFHLSPRQQATLAFAVMAELDPNLLTAYRYLSHDPACRGLDARLLASLVYDTPESRAHLSRDLSPTSPLLYFRLLEQEEARNSTESMLYRRLRPAARLVQMLATDLAPELDPMLADVATLLPPATMGLFPEGIVRQVEAVLGGAEVALVLQGQRGIGKRLLANIAATKLGKRILLVDGRQLADRPPESLRALLRAVLREAHLLDAIPLVAEIDDLAPATAETEQLAPIVAQLCRDHRGPVVLTICRERVPRVDQRPVVHLTMSLPTLDTRVELWRHFVPSLDDEAAEALSERFAIPGGIIQLAAEAASATRTASEGAPGAHELDVAVRQQLHSRILRLGRKLETPYTFDDLVAEEDVLSTLWEIVSCVRERRRVREQWGFRGAQGVTVLFSGEPGVGKSMSATVLARALDLAVYEIDLSQVMSKWLGETEKNLAELFDAAEPGHVVLLFNEADSLFGKRTVDVKSSNDRYANLETNYLLQRLERFGGLAVLTTNLVGAIDVAFLRRFAYNVRFPFPEVEMRAELWRRAIPARAEAGPIDFQALAESYELSGGFIKVAAERAAFMAAGVGEIITQELITLAIEQMYRERGKLTSVGRLD